MSAVDLDLFARPNRLPSTIQIIAGPASGPAGPFALIQRYSDQAGGVGDTEAIGQWQAAVRAYSNGNGEATWNLADGTQGYLRSRGLDREELVRIIRDLTPRDAAAAVPGFDYTPQGDEGALSLQAEHVSTGVHGGGAASACQVQSNTHLYRVAVLFGDPVYQYALVIDRPVPLEVGFGDGGALIVIGGLADASAPTVSDVVNADPDQWERLLTQPMP